MGLSGKIKASIAGTSRDVSGKITERYREHVGEELLKKQEALDTLEAELNQREARLSAEESKRTKYYRVPRLWFDVPITLAVVGLGVWGYRLFQHSEAAWGASENKSYSSINVSNLVSGSDDLLKHRAVFERAAQQLIAKGTCSAKDFREMGGWVKSATTYKNQPVYFTYCGGGMSQDGRIYLDASNGRIFK